MPYVISNIDFQQGTVQTQPNSVVDIINYQIPTDFAIVEAYIDLSQLQSGDKVELTEYVAFPNAQQQAFAIFTATGPLQAPVVRLHSKTLPNGATYRVTVKQTNGQQRQIAYMLIVTQLTRQ